MIVWDKLTVTNTYGAATMSINAAGLVIDRSISVPTINVDSITANNGIQIDTATATFSGNVTVSGSTTLSGNVTVSGSAIFNESATFNEGATFNKDTTFNGSAAFNAGPVTLTNAQNKIVLPHPGASQKILQVSGPGISGSHYISIAASNKATLTLGGFTLVTDEIKVTNGVVISTYSTDTNLQLKYGITDDKIDNVLTRSDQATMATEFGKLTIVKTFDSIYDIYLQVGGLNSAQTASGWVSGKHEDHWWFIELLNSHIPYSILNNSIVLSMDAYENKRVSPYYISGNNTLYGYKSEWQVALIKKDDKYYLCLGLDSYASVSDVLISGIGHIRIYSNNN